MKPFVLDANAVIRYLLRSQDWEKVKALFAEARHGEARLFISAVNWSEVIYSLGQTSRLIQSYF